MSDRVKMINTILHDYRKAKMQEWKSGDIEWNYTELDFEVGSFCEQLQFFYSDEQLIELYNLVK